MKKNYKSRHTGAGTDLAIACHIGTCTEGKNVWQYCLFKLEITVLLPNYIPVM